MKVDRNKKYYMVSVMKRGAETGDLGFFTDWYRSKFIATATTIVMAVMEYGLFGFTIEVISETAKEIAEGRLLGHKLI